MTVKRGIVTDRVALACVEATRPWFVRLAADYGVGNAATSTSTFHILILQLLNQLAKQGLTPDDLDTDDGRAAVEAIAMVVFSALRRPRRQAHAQEALLLTVPVEWKHVANAALRLLARDPRVNRR